MSAPAGSPVDALLEGAGAGALLVVGRSGDDADLARFAAGAKLGEAFVVQPIRGRPRLGFMTPMERDEAASTGLDLLTPEALDVARWARDGASAAATLAGVLARALQLCEVPFGPVALAGSWAAGPLVEASLSLARDGWILVTGSEIALRLRKEKTREEIDETSRVAKVTVAAFRDLAELLAGTMARDGELWLGGERLKIGSLKREIARRFAQAELSQPRGNIVAPAEEGGVPHTAGSPERVLRPGESLVVDLYPRGRLFADCTRTFCVGEPPAPLAAAHTAAREALLRAHAETRPGVTGWELQEVVCRLLAERGYPTPISHPGTLVGYVHGLGHGVGYELHEYPSFKRHAGAEGILEVGDVVTLEPGIYDPGPGGYGVRLEDLVVLEPEGPRNLTPLPYDLDPRAWF
jgi:Xaa-Pro aminopeptidase